ncbi:MoaD/ThiS family protein [Parapedobacter tibetensis]|uniref:MoaD/ThiS family protein n=1 Tax=Parapedobacter tibetensis TaxID=2972951 RepID=UPI00214DAA2C|nr:MoaD/ThiS family protein [Parapedobacter tibetensis]
MEISVFFFGQLTDIIGSRQVRLSDVSDTDALENTLKARYPMLRQSKYVIAVNRKIIREKMDLTSNAEVALLPPFSGG